MPNILFICALEQEKRALTDTLDACLEVLLISPHMDIKVERYRQHDLDIYVCESGMGNVNAGTNLALILNQLNIHQVILIGVGGALDSQLNIGDMIISDQVIQHDYHSSLDSGNYLMRPGDLILDAQQAVNYDPVIRSSHCIFNPKALSHNNIEIKHALIASGSEFVGTAQRKHAIYKQCQQALLVDMEASAIASISNQFNTPFLVAKTVSDKLHTDGSISQDFSKFLDAASRNAALIAQLIIASMLEPHDS
jgi:5'-methylthioadenosine/S-adenosylhomocysteine nucleosidase